ncbi:MAG: PHB depolymerase family esterase [Bacteroidota bacterium]
MPRIFCIAFVAIGLLSCTSDDNEMDVLTPESFPEFVNGTLDHQNRVREYVLHIPETYQGSSEVPLVIFLHGGGGNAQSAQGFTNFNLASEENGFLVAYPQGFHEAAPNSFVWADGRGLPPDDLGIDDVGFINALVDELVLQYAIDERKVYLCGFSNGSFLTQRIAFEDNARFAAMGTLGGTMNEEFLTGGGPGRPIPMIYVFGTDDGLVPYDGGFVSDNEELESVIGVEAAVDYWVQNNECATALTAVDLPDLNTNDNSIITVFEYTDCACSNAQVMFYRVEGAGHTWPGVVVPNANLGNTNLDVQASRELWAFFDRFELCF